MDDAIRQLIDAGYTSESVIRIVAARSQQATVERHWPDLTMQRDGRFIARCLCGQVFSAGSWDELKQLLGSHAIERGIA